MSVDYSAHIYYGYNITPEDLKFLSEETIEELRDEELLHRIDCYSEHSRMILGYDVKVTDSITTLPNIAIADPLSVIQLYYDCFSEMPKTNPNFYLGLRVS